LCRWWWWWWWWWSSWHRLMLVSASQPYFKRMPVSPYPFGVHLNLTFRVLSFSILW
jgi:hypothetical protein